jgi:predicted Zn-dependent protease with MMP-like domain
MLPEKITLYRRPILAEWRETGVGLEQLVSHIVIHEIGHHFGFSDDDMHALEDQAG